MEVERKRAGHYCPAPHDEFPRGLPGLRGGGCFGVPEVIGAGPPEDRLDPHGGLSQPQPQVVVFAAPADKVLVVAVHPLVIGPGDADVENGLIESMRWFCRSIELCDDYLRGYYGLKLVSSPLATARSGRTPETLSINLTKIIFTAEDWASTNSVIFSDERSPTSLALAKAQEHPSLGLR